MEYLKELDKEVFLYLNNLHTPWLDPIVMLITQTWAWIPLYLFLLYLVIKEHKKESWIVLLGIAITIVLADQITSTIMKPFFARLRPSHEPSLLGLVHLVNDFSGEIYKGGMFGFASSHAANTFGTAAFFWLLFHKRKKWVNWLFLWALVMTYTRIYLGVHYPGDILVGGFIGILCAWVGFNLFLSIKRPVDKIKLSSSKK